MDSRKLQRSKSGSYLVTLPKSWVQQKNLDKGNRVEINQEEDGSLRILSSKEETSPKNRSELKVEDFPNLTSLENMVKACYMQGAEEIHIKSEKGTITEEKEKLRNILPDLIASEVTEDRPNEFTIRVLADPRSFSISDLLERISKLISSIHQDTARALREKDPELASDASYRGIDINRLHRLTMRQLSLSMEDHKIAKATGISNHMECLLYAVSFRDLCRMGYHVKRAAEFIEDLYVGLEKELLNKFTEMSEILLKMQKNSSKSLENADPMLANEVVKDMEKIKEYDEKITSKTLEKDLDQKVSFASNSLSTNWRRAAGHAVGVADIAISLSASRSKRKK